MFANCVVPLRPGGSKHPLFLVHGVDGDVARFENLLPYLAADQPVYGILAQGLLRERVAFTRVEEMARYYVEQIRQGQPHGPYQLAGYSFGGFVAFEMALQLRAKGERVGFLGLIDPIPMGGRGKPAGSDLEKPNTAYGGGAFRAHLSRALGPNGFDYACSKLTRRLFRLVYTYFDQLKRPIPRVLQSAPDINWFAGRLYRPGMYAGRVTLFRLSETPKERCFSEEEWSTHAAEGVEVQELSGSHGNIFYEPDVRSLAEALNYCLTAKSRVETSRPVEQPSSQVEGIRIGDCSCGKH